LKPGLEDTGVIAQREGLHALQYEELDLGDLGKTDEGSLGLRVDHGTGT
jgi:hypothetical protein